MTRPSIHDVSLARGRIADTVWRTPLVEARWLASGRGGSVWLKLESLQRTRSFKIRGALNAVRALVERAAAGATAPVTRVVTASAGNHGLALSLAAARAGLGCVVFTPADAPASKLGAIRAHGADLRAVARDYDHAERLAITFSADEGAPYISPYNDPDVIAGAGTVALEVLEDLPGCDALLVPTGGGGLLSGTLVAARATAPGVRVVGVEAERNPAFRTALGAGRITPIALPGTIADGLAGNLEPGAMTWDIVRELVDDVVTVGEPAIRLAIRALLGEEHLVVEGAGAVAVAAVLGGEVAAAGRSVVALVTGANIDLPLLLDVAGTGP